MFASRLFFLLKGMEGEGRKEHILRGREEVSESLCSQREMHSYWVQGAASRSFKSSLEPPGCPSVWGPSCFCTRERDPKRAVGVYDGIFMSARSAPTHHLKYRTRDISFPCIANLRSTLLRDPLPLNEAGEGSRRQSVPLASH